MKGHLDQKKKNCQSTKLTDLQDIHKDIEPKEEANNKCTGDTICSILDTMYITSKSYSDQTRKFPAKFSKSNQYIFILYHFDTNTTNAVPLKRYICIQHCTGLTGVLCHIQSS